ncbi:MAG: replicative DNA helicase [Pseudomonadota bacterium]|uniref:DNA 5'-3' helicase n=2 Tax=viral metagenome TaxID=1070528 RepID=A0A6M3Y441_9ZZZZ
MTTKPLPQSTDYEESVLSSCFHGDAAEIVDILSPSDFYRTAHLNIFQAICDLNKKGVDINLVSVVDKLTDAKCLEVCGGATYLASLLDVPIAHNITHFCGKVRDKAIQRDLIKECNEITKLCFDEPDIEKIVDEAQRRVGLISNRAIESKGDSSFSYRVLVEEATDRYEELSKRPGTITGLSSGYFMIDYILCGFQPSDLIILAAKPSMGKTALALNMAGNMGKAGDPVAIFSLEMSKEQLIDRQTAGESGVNSQKFRSGKFEKEDWPKIQAVQSKIYEWPVFIDDSAALHYREIHRRAWQLKKKHGIKAIFVDHLQLVRGDKAATRDREIGSITAGLKATAKELKIPVILLSQLSRKVDGRSEKRPVISDLRDSGNIEQDADVVMFIYRPAQYKEEEEYEGQTEISISKQRNGPTGVINLKWNEKVTRFFEVDKRREE